MKIVSDYPINTDVLAKVSAIHEDYEILVSRRIGKENNKILLSDSVSNKCRFCGNSFPVVRFDNLSHAIPDFIGNRSLISEYECDTCNSEYFKLFENEMANFMLPHSVLSGVVRKGNKISKYNQKGQPVILNKDNTIIISELPDSVVMDIKESNIRSYKLEVTIPSFIPEFIFRCLIKIALSIVPEDKLDLYLDTISWLMNLDIQSNIPPFMLFSMYPSHIQSNEIVCTVFTRKEDSLKNIPHSVLFISYNNFAFQTCIPFSSKEKVGVELLLVPFICPTALDLNNDNNGMRVDRIIDLNSKDKKRKENVSYTIKW